MKTRSRIIASIAAVLLAFSAAVAYAAQGDDAKKAECFKLHARLMDKPALTNPNDCWRAHGYLVDRQLKLIGPSR